MNSSKPATRRLKKYLKPEWEGHILGYVMNSMAAQYWRVERTLSREEYVQEAWIVFDRVRRTYEGRIRPDEPQHFTALFKMAWCNRLNDLSKKNTRYRETFVSMGGAEAGGEQPRVDYFESRVGESGNEGELSIAIRQAPREVSSVLSLFLNAPQELLDVALAGWREGKARPGQNPSAHICKLLGFDIKRDVMAEVERYFAA